MDCIHCGYYKTADAGRSWECALFTPLWLAHFTVCSEGLISICAICCLLFLFLSFLHTLHQPRNTGLTLTLLIRHHQHTSSTDYSHRCAVLPPGFTAPLLKATAPHHHYHGSEHQAQPLGGFYPALA